MKHYRHFFPDSLRWAEQTLKLNDSILFSCGINVEIAVTTIIHLSWVCVSIRVSSKKVLDFSVTLPLGSLGEVNTSNIQPSDL